MLKVFFNRRGMLLSVASLTMPFLIPAAARASATSVPVAAGTITEATSSAGMYQYDLKLVNAGISGGAAIGSFWFAWLPGEDFLTSNPISQTAPTGWTATPQLISGGGGASIQFTANSTGDYLQSGQSLSGFSFTTPDAPSNVFGQSVPFPNTLTTTSVAYHAGLFSDSGAQFVFTPVPEPGPLALITTSVIGLSLLVRRRKSM